MRILVIVAHPDDEVIGLGGTLHKLSRLGAQIHVLFLTDGRSSRKNYNIKDDIITKKSIEGASRILKYSYIQLKYKDNQLDKYPLLKLVKECEKAINLFKPDILYTHWYHDINIDHQITCRAALTAARPIQGNNNIKKVFEFETLSETEWTIDNDTFFPNFFSVLTDSDIYVKQKALESYDSEMHKETHPRSYQIIKLNAKVWGAKVGKDFAEALILFRGIDQK